MKTIMIVLALMALLLTAGVVSAAVPEKELGNGITAFKPVSNDDGSILVSSSAAGIDVMAGSAAGGLRPDKKLYNGITYFDAKAPGDSYSKWTGRHIANGITLFDDK